MAMTKLKAMALIKNLEVFPPFQNAMRALTPYEFDPLKRQIIADKEVRDAIVIYGNKILDGHHRHRIFMELLGTPDEIATPRIIRKEFKTDAEAICWIANNQQARRNLTPAEISAMRGAKYNGSKTTQGGDRKIKGQDLHFDAAAKIAKEDGVSVRTVKTDGAYHAHLGKISGMLPDGNYRHTLVDAEVPKSVIAAIAGQPNRPAMQDAVDMALAAGKSAKVASSDELKEAARQRKAALKEERAKESARKAKRAKQAAEDEKRQRVKIETSRKARATKALKLAKKTGTGEQAEQLDQYSELRTKLQLAGLLPEEDINSIRHILSQDLTEVFQQLTDDEFEMLDNMVYAERTRRGS